jgi:hypothetical protein
MLQYPDFQRIMAQDALPESWRKALFFEFAVGALLAPADEVSRRYDGMPLGFAA